MTFSYPAFRVEWSTSHRIELELPPVRDLLSAQDPRAIALAVGNRKAERWQHARPGERKVTNPIPRALRAKGYEPVASLISAWTGQHIDVGTVRSWWRFDLAREESSYLPPPDAIIKRKGGTLLPGWADETIREWLSTGRPGMLIDVPNVNVDTYLPWADRTDEIDPRVVALLAGNQERDIRAISQPPRRDGVPAAYLALGYKFAAEVITATQDRTVNEYTMCTYWREDLLRNRFKGDEPGTDPYSLRLPVPDALISRGPRGDLLPGWTESTIKAWVPTRPGPGNRTSGQFRRGHTRATMGVEVDTSETSTSATDLAVAVPA